MARARQFDGEKALEQALTLFRKQGYQASSLADLMKTMGLSRSSFYATFGSKHELFLATLASFDKTAAIYNVIEPDSGLPSKALLAQVFARAIASVIGGQGGCLFGNCAVEFSSADQPVLDHVTNGMQQLQEMFAEVIEIGQRKGDVPKDKSAQAIASNLVATYYGIQTMAKAGLSLDALKQVISQALLQLD